MKLLEEEKFFLNQLNLEQDKRNIDYIRNLILEVDIDDNIEEFLNIFLEKIERDPKEFEDEMIKYPFRIELI